MLRLLEKEMESFQQRLDTILEMYKRAIQQHAKFENNRESFYNLLTIEHTIMQNRANIAWIQQCMNRIELGDYSPKLDDE